MTSHRKPLEVRVGVADVCPPKTVLPTELRTTKIPILTNTSKSLTQIRLNPASVGLS
jgi:hypothetical protein